MNVLDLLTPLLHCVPTLGFWYLLQETHGVDKLKFIRILNPSLCQREQHMLDNSAQGCQTQYRHLGLSPCMSLRDIVSKSGGHWLRNPRGPHREHQEVLAPKLCLWVAWIQVILGSILSLFVFYFLLELLGNRLYWLYKSHECGSSFAMPWQLKLGRSLGHLLLLSLSGQVPWHK